MNGRIQLKIGDKTIQLWFNNFSKIELGKSLLTTVNGYPAKPNEIEFLQAIQKKATENHLVLLRDVVFAGVIGHAYGTDNLIQYTKLQIAEIIATAKEDDLYEVWTTFMDAMGMNLDGIITEAKKKVKKKKATA